MKKILLLSSGFVLLALTGCLVSDGGGRGYYRGHGHYENHAAVIVGPPAVAVRVPEVVVRPPELIVR